MNIQLLKENLHTKFIGQRIEYFEEINSTNEYAMEIASNISTPEGTVVIANYQTAGKGRRGRTWSSPPESSILTSIILRPPKTTAVPFKYTAMSSLAVVKALGSSYNINTGIKWPNDIYLNNMKLGGILVEQGSTKSGDIFFVIGIGINVNIKNFPSEIQNTATSLQIEYGKEFKKEKILAEIYNFLEEYYTNQNFFSEWKDRNIIIGKQIRVTTDCSEFDAHCLDTGEKGELIIQNGKIMKLFAGDVTIRF